MKLNYELTTVEERTALVEQILAETENPTPRYLDILADYIVFCMDKDEKKEKKIMRENRRATINKHETSYEGLTSQFENGEDGVYNLLSDEKHTIFRPKIRITEEDLAEIPELHQAKASIASWERVLETAEGKEAFIAKKALIESRKEQYTIRSAFRQTVGRGSKTTQQPRTINKIVLEGSVTFDSEGYCVPHGVSLINPAVCSAILCDYTNLHLAADKKRDSDVGYLMDEFDKIALAALAHYPLYKELMRCKIAEMQNVEIQAALQEKFGTTHSLEYISSLWRKKIPEIIATQAEDNYLEWYYTNVEKGQWKKCSRCGEVKLAHNKYFSKNSTSKDNFYSICKECRNKKKDPDRV